MLINFNIFDNKLSFRVNVPNSSDYVKSFKSKIKVIVVISFYSTSGFNNKLGSKDTFEIKFDNQIDKIYFYTNNNRYKLVLIKKNNK